MKDLYSFDVGLDEAKVTYDEIDSAYKALFTELGIPWKKGNKKLCISFFNKIPTF